VHTHRASVHQAAKLFSALLRVARVTVGLAESNGSLLPGLCTALFHHKMVAKNTELKQDLTKLKQNKNNL